METLLQDIRYAWRMLLKSPGFSSIAILTLTLGIGANTAVFSVVDAVLLHPLPYKNPDQLMLVSETLPMQGHDLVGVSAAEYLDYRERNRSFSETASFERDGFNLTGEGTPLRINAALVSASAFPLLGVDAVLGRTFTEEEDRNGAEKVVVISRPLWEQHYGSDPHVLGKIIKLDEKPYTVIGVMPASFRFPFDSAPASERADLWLPEIFSADRLQNRTNEFGVGFIGRLRPGVTAIQAQKDVENVAAGFMKDHPESYPGTIRVSPIAQAFAAFTVEKTRPLVLLLVAAVACVLLIACANVANLLLARANHRSREMAIRSALGAERLRLLQQCLAESGLISLFGASGGILLASVLVDALRKLGPASLPRLQDTTLHPATLVFTLVLSVVTSLLFGFLPAWRLSQTSAQESMKQTAQIGMSRRAHRLQNLVAIAEIAAALVLLIGSSLLMQSFVHLLNVPLGIQPEGAVVVRTLFDRARYPDPLKRDAVQKELIERLAHLPGVNSAAAASHLPLSDERQIGFRLEHAAPDDYHWAANSLVSPGYFRTMGISLLRGRDFSPEDRRDAPDVAIINETMAKQFFAGRDPLGQRFQWGDREFFTIVGVAADVRISGLDADPPPMIYDSMFQIESGASGRTAFILRSTASSNSTQQGMFRAVQQQVWAVDKDIPLYDTTTLSTLVSESVAQRRFTTLLIGSFAAVALTLAMIGLFGVVSYLVAERMREMAVRMALGADRVRIAWLVLQQGGTLGLVGCLVGLALFVGTSKVFAANLYQTNPFDPTTLVLVPTLLLAVTLLAAYVPARRATRVDPMVALRYE
jgi:putative ABC transport system permease protein